MLDPVFTTSCQASENGISARLRPSRRRRPGRARRRSGARQARHEGRETGEDCVQAHRFGPHTDGLDQKNPYSSHWFATLGVIRLVFEFRLQSLGSTFERRSTSFALELRTRHRSGASHVSFVRVPGLRLGRAEASPPLHPPRRSPRRASARWRPATRPCPSATGSSIRTVPCAEVEAEELSRIYPEFRAIVPTLPTQVDPSAKVVKVSFAPSGRPGSSPGVRCSAAPSSRPAPRPRRSRTCRALI